MNGWIVLHEGKAWGPFQFDFHAREWAEEKIGMTGWLLARLVTPVAFTPKPK